MTKDAEGATKSARTARPRIRHSQRRPARLIAYYQGHQASLRQMIPKKPAAAREMTKDKMAWTRMKKYQVGWLRK